MMKTGLRTFPGKQILRKLLKIDWNIAFTCLNITQNQWAFMKARYNYIFIQILWCFFVYNVIQTKCLFFLEQSSRLL